MTAGWERVLRKLVKGLDLEARQRILDDLREWKVEDRAKSIEALKS